VLQRGHGAKTLAGPKGGMSCYLPA
jgi:hypothetical protein